MDTRPPEPSVSSPFRGHSVFLTGASSGLGEAIARAFAPTGARLALVARSADKLEAIARQLGLPGDRVLVVAADVTQRDQVQQAVARTVEHFGGIDIAIHCAGVGLLGMFTDASIEDLRKVWDTNFSGAVHLVQSTLPALRRNRDSQLVFISSILGLRAVPRSAMYSASKAAVNGLAESLRMELKRDGIHVLTVCPGRIATPFMEHARSLDGKKGVSVERSVSPEAAAALILKAIAKRKRQLVFPLEAKLLHWLNLWFPGLVDRLVLHRFQKEGLI